MSVLVATGQITIVDNNDARPITAYVTASGGTQQIYTKDESTISFTPDYTGANNTLTAKVYVGGTSSATDVTAIVTNKKWSNDLSTSLGSNTTLVLNTNLDPVSAPSKVYYFEADYTDPVTALVSHIIAQITISIVKTGTNAVYVVTRGTTAIQEANGSAKNVAVVCADLMRAAGVDTSGITYQFYKANGATQVDNTMTTLFGMKTTAGGAQPSGTSSDVGTNLPASGAWGAYNTIVVSEAAISSMDVLRAVAKDADGNTYQAYFTIYDVTDAYSCKPISTAGDKFQNGVGSTSVYPSVYNGSVQVTDFTSWSFKWWFYDRSGNKAAFIDTTRTAQTGGRTISANTTGASAVFTYGGSAITMAAGDVIKCVKPTGTEYYYEVASATGNTVTVRVPATVSTFLSSAVWPAPASSSDFVNGKLYVCVGTGATACYRTSTGSTGVAAAITVTGDEVDVKGSISCEATRP